MRWRGRTCRRRRCSRSRCRHPRAQARPRPRPRHEPAAFRSLAYRCLLANRANGRRRAAGVGFFHSRQACAALALTAAMSIRVFAVVHSWPAHHRSGPPPTTLSDECRCLTTGATSSSGYAWSTRMPAEKPSDSSCCPPSLLGSSSLMCKIIDAHTSIRNSILAEPETLFEVLFCQQRVPDPEHRGERELGAEQAGQPAERVVGQPRVEAGCAQIAPELRIEHLMRRLKRSSAPAMPVCEGLVVGDERCACAALLLDALKVVELAHSRRRGGRSTRMRRPRHATWCRRGRRRCPTACPVGCGDALLRDAGCDARGGREGYCAEPNT